MGTITASENTFPLVRLVEGAAPSTPPTGEAHLYVKSDGLLYWKDDAGTEYPVRQGVASLDDVDLTGLADGDVLLWDDGAGLWVPGTAGGSVAELDDVGDVNAPTPSAGDVLTWDDTPGEWIAAAPSGGSGLVASKVGYTTIGGSTETAQNRIRLKKVTLPACVVLGMDIYLKQVTSGQSTSIAAALLTDNAGTPELNIASYVPKATDGLFLSTSNGAAGAARWHTVPLGGRQVSAGDYWLAFYIDSSTAYEIYKDGSGADRYYSPSAFRMSDAGWTTVTTTTDRYSAYLNILS